MRAPDFYRGREQTYAKHFFLEQYLERVAWNILSFRDEFVYVDGFSGPWQSDDEEFHDSHSRNCKLCRGIVLADIHRPD
jgi:hypothetical protein